MNDDAGVLDADPMKAFFDFMDTASGYDFDRKGKPISHSRRFELDNENYRRVAKTTFADGTLVSTVWIGTDPNYDGTGRPRVFETMVDFDGSWCMSKRYCGEVEALAGHCVSVGEVSMRLRDPESWRREQEQEEQREVLWLQLLLTQAPPRWRQ